MNFLPADYAWLEPVLIAAVVVFVSDLIGNLVSFGDRFGNALVTTIVFVLIYGALIYFGYAELYATLSTTQDPTAPGAGVINSGTN